VNAVITTDFSQHSEQADFAMPASRRAEIWQLRALPRYKAGFTGGVSVLEGRTTGDVCIVDADPTAFRGTPAWSPPT
jgi:hypothetical protein